MYYAEYALLVFHCLKHGIKYDCAHQEVGYVSNHYEIMFNEIQEFGSSESRTETEKSYVLLKFTFGRKQNEIMDVLGMIMASD